MIKYYFQLLLFLFTFFSAFAQNNKKIYEDSIGLYSISSINLIGNDKTKEKIIKRELNFNRGEQYTIRDLDKLIDESYKNLTKLSLFNYITIEKEFLENNQLRINIILEERWFVWPQLSMINNDRNFNTWWKTRDFSNLDYRVAVKQYNVFGLNHTLHLGMSYGYTREFSLAYRNVAIGISQQHFLDAKVYYFRQFSAFYRTNKNKAETLKLEDEDILSGISALVNYTFRPKHRSKHSFVLSFNNIKIADTLLNIRHNFLAKNNNINKYLQLSYTYIFDSRNDASFPLTGNRFQFSIVKRGFGLFKNHPVNSMYFYTNYKQFYKIINRLYGAHSISAKTSLQKEVPYYYKKGLGYIDFLRGFEYYVIEGENFFLVKNTLNFELLPKMITTFNFIPIRKFKKIHYSIYLSSYFDIGYAHEKDEEVLKINNLSNKLIYSSGLGINFVTYYDKVFRLEYSFNSLGETGLFLHFKASI